MESDRRADPATTGRAPHAPREPARLPVIDTQRCTGCGRCVAVCAPHLLSLEVVRWKKSAVLQQRARCTGCGACLVACPFHAVTWCRQVAVR